MENEIQELQAILEVSKNLIEQKLLNNVIQYTKLYNKVGEVMSSEFTKLNPQTQDEKLACYDKLCKKWNWDAITDGYNSAKFQYAAFTRAMQNYFEVNQEEVN